MRDAVGGEAYNFFVAIHCLEPLRSDKIKLKKSSYVYESTRGKMGTVSSSSETHRRSTFFTWLVMWLRNQIKPHSHTANPPVIQMSSKSYYPSTNPSAFRLGQTPAPVNDWLNRRMLVRLWPRLSRGAVLPPTGSHGTGTNGQSEETGT